jgi:transcriptional regulator with XRE-family HTH domain
MTDYAPALVQRAKTIGEMIREARLAAGIEMEECAAVIGVTPETFASYESGAVSFSLPELEAIAYILDIPLDAFWDSDVLRAQDSQKQATMDMTMVMRLRHRMIGAVLRQARLEAGITLEKLANHLQVEVTQLEAYELGKDPDPVPELELLSGLLTRSIREFLDQHGPVGAWNAQQRALREFLAMPPELRTFVSKPVNRPYLDLAVRLSEMSVDRLRPWRRAVGDYLLNQSRTRSRSKAI